MVDIAEKLQDKPTESRPQPTQAKLGVRDARQEFWKPAIATRHEAEQISVPDLLCGCGATYIPGARFCHVCGVDRQPVAASIPRTGYVPFWTEIGTLRDRLEQSTASLVALALGISGVVAAVVTGMIYTANTMVDWQAVQLWRIEWLLAAIAAFVAGIQLKKK